MERTGVTVPDHFFHNPRLRRFAWPFTAGMLSALLIITTVLVILITDARRDVGGLQAAGRTAEVATCYASARGRPLLGNLLRVIGAAASTQADRAVVNEAISQYVNSARTEEECAMLARARGLDPADFPAPPPPPGTR